MENEKVKAKIFYVLKSIIFAAAMVALILYLLAAFFIYSYNRDAEERRKPIRDLDNYTEFAYIKPTYEKYKEYIGFHKIAAEEGGIISYRVTINDSADKALWLDIVSGFAEDIENSGQLIKMIFYDTDYTENHPYCIWISNCNYINDSGEVRYCEGDKVCYADFKECGGNYDFAQMLAALNVEYIKVSGGFAFNEKEFADMLCKTAAQKLLVRYGGEEDELEEKQQALQQLMPDIQVWFK